MKRITINCDSRDLEGGVLHLKNRISNVRRFRILSAEIPNSCYVVPPEQTITITPLSFTNPAQTETQPLDPIVIAASNMIAPVPSINDFYLVDSSGNRTVREIQIGEGGDSLLGFIGGSFNPLGIEIIPYYFALRISRFEFSSPANPFILSSKDQEFCDALGIEPNIPYTSSLTPPYVIKSPKMIDFNALSYIYLDIEELRPFMRTVAVTSRKNNTDDAYLLRLQMNSDFGKYSFYHEPSASIPFINTTSSLDLDRLTISLRKYRGAIADLNGLSFSFQLELITE